MECSAYSKKRNEKATLSVLRYSSRLLIRLIVLTILLMKAAPLSLADGDPGRCYGSGYKLVGRDALAQDGLKYDRQPIRTDGRIRFTNGVAYLGNYSETSSTDSSQSVVCLQTVERQVKILRQLTSLGVGVLGIYHRVAERPYKDCRNGTITVRSLEVSFE